MSNVTLRIDEHTLTAPKGSLLIQVMLDNGLSIPHFCYHEALEADGNCRMCMVEIEGQKRPQIACNTPIKEGMIVRTTTPSIMQTKRAILELELRNHPVDCPICDQAGECSLQEYYMEVGLYDAHVAKSDKIHKAKHVDLGSHVVLDQERCVLCQRCVRFVHDKAKSADLVVTGRGATSVISAVGAFTGNGYAMNVVDLCPVGALTSSDFRFAQRVWFLQSDASICHGCARGCNIHLDHHAIKGGIDTLYRLRPRKNSAVNGHFMCDTGRISYKSLNENRLLEPHVEGHATSFSHTFSLLRRTLDDKSQTIVALVSPHWSLENLASVKLFCARFEIPLFGAHEASIEPSFADEWLRVADRAPNRAGLELLGIDVSPHARDRALSRAQVVLDFGHDATLSSMSTRYYFGTHPHSDAQMQLPVAAYSEESGHLINCDNIVQHYSGSVKRSEPLLSLHALLGLLVMEGAWATQPFWHATLIDMAPSLEGRL